ncbi:MAG: BACON domain-containing carbohydrate-binding protein [Bacteroides sp.]|uniref:BACON domain-containing protein n=1 Tax=Bacteroides sp. TaxID=29523 RepID=UPI0026DFD29C|nr:BACON domain-containing carbohydrate-binding protein [Bacteroides sp.]MDO5419533.1 BACON domain-containing carbohydrate-binding protein [Bacteroides sp.]
MKRIYTMLLFVGCLLVAAACSDDEEKSVESTLKVIESNVKFGAKAASGIIEVEGLGEIKASSSESWCTVSVSGNVITVQVSALRERESRSALVTVSDNLSSVEVPVHQKGVAWGVGGQDAYLFDASGKVIVLPFVATCEYEATASDSWIVGKETEEGYEVTIAANDGNFRKGTLTLQSDLGESVFTFSQLSADGIQGDFIAQYITVDDENMEVEAENPVKIVKVSDSEYNIVGLSTVYDIPLTFDLETGSVYVKNGTYLGEFPTVSGDLFYAYTMIMGLNLENGKIYINYGTTPAMNIPFSLDADTQGKLKLSLYDSGLWTNCEIFGMNIYIFSKKEFASANSKGWFETFRHLTFTQQ